jgi:hypothetical protein
MQKALSFVVAVVLMVVGAPMLGAPAHAKQCDPEEFFKQSIDYTPAAFTARFSFDVRCLPKGTKLVFGVEGTREDILVTEEARDDGSCKTGRQGPCKFVLSFDHDAIERADYHLAMTLTLTSNYFASSASVHESWTCTSAAAIAFCE